MKYLFLLWFVFGLVVSTVLSQDAWPGYRVPADVTLQQVNAEIEGAVFGVLSIVGLVGYAILDAIEKKS